jgi:hypothetical protein
MRVSALTIEKQADMPERPQAELAFDYEACARLLSRGEVTGVRRYSPSER